MSMFAYTSTSMTIPNFEKTPSKKVREEENGEKQENMSNEFEEMILSLPKERGWRTPYLYKFQGFWCQPKEIQAIISFQKHFKAMDTDVILATIPKSGTTWLKALVFSIVNRRNFTISNSHPLLTSNPHDLVPFLEYKLYADNHIPELSHIPTPRLFATHVPFASLQQCLQNTSYRIVYLCRNPMDTFISSWHYINNVRKAESLPQLPLEDAFDMYCKGIVGFGPFWEHMLGYLKQSLERPKNVLFLKYEDMKRDIVSQLMVVAKFLGVPFSVQEEKDGVIEEIAKLCSFDKLRDLEVNKSGKAAIKNFENKHLFRKGEVGDWLNYLSPSMVDKLSKVMEEKFGASGLNF